MWVLGYFGVCFLQDAQAWQAAGRQWRSLTPTAFSLYLTGHVGKCYIFNFYFKICCCCFCTFGYIFMRCSIPSQAQMLFGGYSHQAKRSMWNSAKGFWQIFIGMHLWSHSNGYMKHSALSPPHLLANVDPPQWFTTPLTSYYTADATCLFAWWAICFPVFFPSATCKCCLFPLLTKKWVTSLREDKYNEISQSPRSTLGLICSFISQLYSICYSFMKWVMLLSSSLSIFCKLGLPLAWCLIQSGA